jgi:hypothetical protein
VGQLEDPVVVISTTIHSGRPTQCFYCPIQIVSSLFSGIRRFEVLLVSWPTQRPSRTPKPTNKVVANPTPLGTALSKVSRRHSGGGSSARSQSARGARRPQAVRSQSAVSNALANAIEVSSQCSSEDSLGSIGVKELAKALVDEKEGFEMIESSAEPSQFEYSAQWRVMLKKETLEGTIR